MNRFTTGWKNAPPGLDRFFSDLVRESSPLGGHSWGKGTWGFWDREKRHGRGSALLSGGRGLPPESKN